MHAFNIVASSTVITVLGMYIIVPYYGLYPESWTLACKGMWSEVVLPISLRFPAIRRYEEDISDH